MIPSVYVAGSSKELDRCSGWISRLKQEGLHVTYDWTVPVSKLGSAGETLKDYERRAFARMDLRGVEEANFLWLLVPSNHSLGAWIEFGYALRGAGDHPHLHPEKRIVISPPVSDRCILATLPAVVEFASDEAAFEWITKCP